MNDEQVLKSLDELKKSIDQQIKNDSDYRNSLAEKNSKELESQLKMKVADDELMSKRYDVVDSHFSLLEKNQGIISKQLDLINLDETNSNLIAINSKLSNLITILEKSEDTQKQEDFQHFTNLSIVFFLFCVLPMFFTIKFLSKILDSASA